MDDDDDGAPSSTSRSPSSSPPTPPISVVHPSSLLPPPNGDPSESVTVATPAPHKQTLTLALPIQPPPGSAAAAGRDDCWSEGASSSLIDAWGDRFLDLGRGNLKLKQWQEVAEAVSSREDYTKPPRSDLQCKNRIDTLKKKYKAEKSKISAAGSSVHSSSWPFFNRLDLLLGPIMRIATSTGAVATAALSHFPQKRRTGIPVKRKASSSLPPPASASSTSDSFPPVAPANGRRRRVGMAGMRDLTQAILKFGDVYQRVESSKLQQTVEMEKQRIEFAGELEMQRMRFFMKTQMELSQLRRHLP